jgi:hypothetical protein
VGAIYLVHGTFAGFDALGLLAGLARAYPAGRAAIARIGKYLVDTVVNDAGNFTQAYAARLEEGLSHGCAAVIPVRTFAWSSENHHLGRADAAVRLLDELVTRRLPAGKRILLWGHSHGGNVFALLSNLLAGDGESNRRFFDAARVYYQWPATGFVDIPVWKRLEEALCSSSRLLEANPLDLVTLGTPIRYGWDACGYSRLLHFINHHPQPGVPPHLAVFPPRVEDVFRAAGGDYVQQVGIAGTNVMPSPVAWRSWTADRRLNALLQPGYSARDLVARLKLGARVHDSGTTLLLDYGPPKGNLAQHLAGHAVYTRYDWLTFHAEQVARWLYGYSPPTAENTTG